MLNSISQFFYSMLYTQEELNAFLAKSIRTQDVAEVKNLLASGAQVNEPHERFTPLVRAAITDNAELVRLLLENGADLDSRSSMGAHSAIMHAISFGHINSARYLIERGASLLSKDNNGNAALHHALKLQNNPSVENAQELIALVLCAITNDKVDYLIHCSNKDCQMIDLRDLDCSGITFDYDLI